MTLEDDNLLWLKSRTMATKARSLSETLDELVTQARTSGRIPAATIRSVAGTVDIAADDPNLELADAWVQQTVDASLRRPFLARERPTQAVRKPRSRTRG